METAQPATWVQLELLQEEQELQAQMLGTSLLSLQQLVPPLHGPSILHTAPPFNTVTCPEPQVLSAKEGSFSHLLGSRRHACRPTFSVTSN